MSKASRWQTAFVVICTMALGVRLIHFADVFAVNVLFWDQWDFLNPFFRGDGLLTRFHWQHGPHRQGLGAIVLSALYAASHWNERLDAFFIAGTYVVAAAFGLWLVARTRGALRWFDVVIPALLVSPNSWETIVSAANPSHGALPTLLALAIALALSFSDSRIQLGLTAALTALATFTGFAVFLAPVMMLVFVAIALRNPESRRSAVVAAGSVALSLALFFSGYVSSPAAACFQFPIAEPSNYLRFIGALLLARAEFPLEQTSGSIGLVVALLALAFVGVATWSSVRSRSWPALLLLGFSALFALNVAIGRVCLGFDAALAPRYFPYVSVGLCGAFLFLSTRLAPRAMNVVGALCVALVVLTEPRAFEVVSAQSAAKRQWVACYRRTHSIGGCDSETGQPLHPNAEATRLQEKLDFLERHQLSFFAR